MTVRILAAAALAMTLAACGSPSDEPSTPPGDAATATTSDVAPVPADAKPAAYAQCVSCHAVEAGKNGLGPSLAGVFGRKAGTGAGFVYSEAMKASGLTWDEATLDEYLTAPMKKVPGTKMSYAGLSDAAKRQELIAYLKALK